MKPNEQIIHQFYTAFKHKDYKTMQDRYADNATFTDPMFTNLNALQVRTMWEMFFVKSKDLKIEKSHQSY